MDVDTREELAEASLLLETAKVSIEVIVRRFEFLVIITRCGNSLLVPAVRTVGLSDTGDSRFQYF